MNFDSHATFFTLSENTIPELELFKKQAGAIRYLEHGNPSTQVRWHYHDEYVLHYMVTSTGKAFIGDYIGRFEPGDLFLTGPYLPYNWVSDAYPQTGGVLRVKMIHFDREFVVGMIKLAPETLELSSVLARAKYGIQFRQQNGLAAQRLDQIKGANGAERLGYFYHLMHELLNREDYTLLSTAQVESRLSGNRLEKLNRVIEYVIKNYDKPLLMVEVSRLISMSESHFSRFFRKATGRCFSDFLSSIRINRACELLQRTDKQITTICYEVGFRNIANFNRRFHERKGLTPSEYRKQALQRIKWI